MNNRKQTISREVAKSSDPIPIHISGKYSQYKKEVQDCFSGLNISVGSYDVHSLSPLIVPSPMQIVIFLGSTILSGLIYDLLKTGIYKLITKFEKAEIFARIEHEINFRIYRNGLVVPTNFCKLREKYSHIKTLDDLFSYLQKTNWKETTLGEVAEVQTGPFGSQLHEKDYVAKGTPIITVENLVNDYINHSADTPKVSEDDKARLSRYVLNEGDIVFSRVGSVDRCGYVSAKENGWLFSGRLLRVRPAKEVFSKYAFYWISQPAIKEYVRKIAVGATMPSINTDLLSQIPISFPPLPEQKGIAAILSGFDDKIELLQRQNMTLEAIAQTIFKEWFIKFKINGKKQKVNSSIGLPEGWRMGKLGDVIEIYGGETPKTNLSEYWNGVIPWFSVVDVPSEGNIFVIKCEKHITQKGLENSSTRMLPVNTTIITARGTVGELALTGISMAMNQSCYGIYPKDGKSFFYLYLVIRGSLAVLKQQVHGAVFDTITRDTLSNIPTNIPPDKIIDLFEDTIRPCFHKVLQNNFQIQTLSKLRNALLPKLMKGEIRINS